MNMPYSLFSILLHGIIFLLFVLTVDFSAKPVIIGDQSAPLVNSYIYKSAFVPKTQTKKLEPEKQKSIISTKKNIEKTTQTAQPVKQASHSSGVQTEELLAILHSAIQQQQHYPESAMQMERQGRATMKFTLFPNGNISDLRLAKSSGTESLDNAALVAIREAAPFNQINKYLNEAKEFSIDVVFELA